MFTPRGEQARGRDLWASHGIGQNETVSQIVEGGRVSRVAFYTMVLVTRWYTVIHRHVLTHVLTHARTHARTHVHTYMHA